MNNLGAEIVATFKSVELSFRPQQGLSIMNKSKFYVDEAIKFAQFPSPTGVKYYEFQYAMDLLNTANKAFPSPTGVKYYEWY